MENVRVVVTGPAWMGAGVESVESAVENMLRTAQNEIMVVAYAIGMGASPLLDRLAEVCERGVSVCFVVNRLDAQTPDARERLGKCAGLLDFRLYDFRPLRPDEDLHAKIMVADRERALVGSSNLSWRGLVTNHELALLVQGKAASEVASTIDRLLNDRHRVFRVPCA